MTNLANLTPYEKKQYLLNKYVKRDYKTEDLVPKYAVYFNPSIEKLDVWKLISVNDTIEQAKFEILFRKKYLETGDGELVTKNDPNFKTWHNELLNVDANGNPFEPGEELMKINYNAPGNMLQVIAGSTPQVPSNNGFKGFAHYAQFDLNEYKGFYEIRTIYEV